MSFLKNVVTNLQNLNTSLCFCFCAYLSERVTGGWGVRDKKEIAFIYWVTFSNDHNSQGWSTIKPETWNPIQVSYMGGAV